MTELWLMANGPWESLCPLHVETTRLILGSDCEKKIVRDWYFPRCSGDKGAQPYWETVDVGLRKDPIYCQTGLNFVPCFVSKELGTQHTFSIISWRSAMTLDAFNASDSPTYPNHTTLIIQKKSSNSLHCLVTILASEPAASQSC